MAFGLNRDQRYDVVDILLNEHHSTLCTVSRTEWVRFLNACVRNASVVFNQQHVWTQWIADVEEEVENKTKQNAFMCLAFWWVFRLWLHISYVIDSNMINILAAVQNRWDARKVWEWHAMTFWTVKTTNINKRKLFSRLSTKKSVKK